VGEGVEDVCFLGHDETGDRGTGPATTTTLLFLYGPGPTVLKAL